MPEHLTHDPLDPIAIDRAGRDSLGNRQTQPCFAARLAEDVRNDIAAIDTATLPERAGELCSRSEAAADGKGRQLSPLGTEPLAALRPACVDNLTPSERLHAGSKTVRALSADLRRLIRALHLGILVSGTEKAKACYYTKSTGGLSMSTCAGSSITCG